jgi:hypothetical protein
MPDMFSDIRGQPQSFADAMRELDQYKIAADQIAACAASEQQAA